MFKKILVATDLDNTSKQAVETAARLAVEQNAALHIVHVIRDPMTQPWAAEAYGVNFIGLLDDLRARAATELTRLRAVVAPAPEAVHTEVLVGAPAGEIVRYAADQKADLIVVGSHGRGALGRAFLGSVAHRVLHEAACPVLTVRPSATGGRRPAEAA